MALMIYFQGRNGETDIGNRPMDMVGGEEGEVWREQHGNLHYHM